MQKTLLLPPDFDQSVNCETGGKGRHLLGMVKAGIQVPSFFILPAETVARFMEPVQKDIDELLSSIASAQDAKLFSVAELIKEKIDSLEFSSFLQTQIKQSCTTIFGENYWLSVRSSAVAEDSAKASFAGQHESFLYVSEADVMDKIKACIASGWSFGSLAYRLAQGISILNIRYAVILQKMVAAKKSGVSFSMNLNGNLADAAIVAGYGLGEGIVQDRVETDFYTVNRQDLHIEKQVVNKKIQVQFSPGEGVVNQVVPSEYNDAAVLTDEEILAVFQLTMQAEQLLGHPSDVEFSFDESGQLYALQMRAVTTLDISTIEILDNTNIVESYPGITLPLSFSFALEAYEKVFRGSSEAFWVSKKAMAAQGDLFQQLLAHYYGRVYYRLDNWYKMIALVHSSARSVAAWEKAVGLAGVKKNTIQFSIWKKVKMFFSVLKLLFNYRRGNHYFFQQFQLHYKELRSFQAFADKPKLLWQHYEKTTAKLFKPWYITLVNDFLAFQFFARLQRIVAPFNLPENTSLANDLLCGTGGVESEEAILNILKLKEIIVADPSLSILFQKSPEEILAVLEDTAASEFGQLFFDHLERFGDRTLTELKLETPSLRNQPQAFIHLLRNQIQTNRDIKDFQKRQAEIRSQAEAQVNAHWKWWQPNAYVFKFVRSLARYGLKNRENMRFCRTRAYGAVKDIFLAIAAKMVEAKVIAQVNDVFYLEVKDLEAFCKNNVIESKAAQIEQLKIQYATYENLRLPDRVIYTKGHLPLMTNQAVVNKTETKINKGIAVSKGLVTAEAVVILYPEPQLQVHGKILISKMTDPGWVFLMMQSAGLISEKGSLLSHTAIVGRELGIPVIVGLKNATTLFKNGDVLTMDGGAGTVELSDNSIVKS
jgi:rifampicin phosphotransferase